MAINIHTGGVLIPTAEEHTPLDFQSCEFLLKDMIVKGTF